MTSHPGRYKAALVVFAVMWAVLAGRTVVGLGSLAIDAVVPDRPVITGPIPERSR